MVIRNVEVIEATEVSGTTQILKINNIVTKITLFRCFEKKNTELKFPINPGIKMTYSGLITWVESSKTPKSLYF